MKKISKFNFSFNFYKFFKPIIFRWPFINESNQKFKEEISEFNVKPLKKEHISKKWWVYKIIKISTFRLGKGEEKKIK